MQQYCSKATPPIAKIHLAHGVGQQGNNIARQSLKFTHTCCATPHPCVYATPRARRSTPGSASSAMGHTTTRPSLPDVLKDATLPLAATEER